MAQYPSRHLQIASAAALAIAFYVSAPAYDHDWSWRAPTVASQHSIAQTPLFEERIVDARPGNFLHAASVVRIGRELVAFWYAGIYEGAADTAIKTSRFDGKSWSPAIDVTDQLATARDLGRFVKTLGNVVPYLMDDGTLHLFYVVVPMRGWSTASLAVKSSTDGGKTWSPARRLVTSPLLNLSTMVKSVPLAAGDGGILLPAYWSLGTQYPMLVRVDRDLRVTGLRQMGNNRAGLQPAIMPSDQRRAMSFLRNLRHAQSVGLTTTSSADGGTSWSMPIATGLPNQGTPTAAARVGPDRILAIGSEGRETVLFFSLFGDDGRLKSRLFEMPTKFNGNKAYPYLIRGSDGVFELMFSCNKNAAICHARFNDAWIEQQHRKVAGGAS